MTISVKKMTTLGILSSLAVLLMFYIRFPIIPAASYLMYEPADVPVVFGAFMFGPVAGLIVTFVVSFIQAITVNAAEGWVGFIMHFIATGTLAVVAGSIYKKIPTIKGAVFALVAGSLSMAAIMIPANLIFTVHFFGVPHDVVVKSIWPIIIPFNLIKASVNSTLAVLVYKSIGRLIHRYAAI